MKVQMQEMLNKLKELLVNFSTYIEMENKNGEFGINKLAENIIGGLLGIIFGCEFKNMNVSSQNYPTIDLADEDKRIAVQITSENASRKILETVAGIKERKLYQQYDMIYIYILTRKKKYKKLKERIGAETGEEFYFPAEHILDLNDIYVRLGSCQDLDKIMQAVSYLSDHLEGPDSHQHSLASQILKAGKEEFLLMMNENRFYADTAECMQKNARAYQGISEKLFPRGFRLPANCEGYGMSEEGAFMPLGELYHEHRNRNLLLLGEGGIGKTTFLVHLMQSFYEKPQVGFQPMPVYIELNRCPAQIGMWYNSHYKKTNFITRYIATMQNGGSYADVEEEKLDQIEEELRKKKEDGNIEYILLLDGMNEVSRNQAVDENGSTGYSVREALRREISVLSTYGNIRLILTSRRMDKVYFPDGMDVLYLRGLAISDIRNYLEGVNYSEVEINEIEASQELLECLQIPLFLCMFACSNQNKEVKPLTRGEILYQFFHKESPFYGERKNIRFSFSKNYNEEIVISFIMDFILPYIGNMMEGAGVFHVPRSDILDGIRYFVRDAEVPFWNTDIEIFREYEKEGYLKDVLEQIRQIPVRQILDCMTGTLGIINYDGRGGYSFIHHHIRDYFSSIYEIQWLRCAVALRCMERKKIAEPSDEVLEALGSIRDEVWPEIKQIFVGEILSEHRNVPVTDTQGNWYRPDPVFQEQLLLKNVLDIFRNNNAYPGKCISNIVKILKKVRKNLSGEDFSGLDLRECRFYETVCSVGEGEKRIAADFKNCILSDDTFFFEGHLGMYEDIDILDDKLYTLGSDERLLIWDLESLQCIKSFEVGNTFYPNTHVAGCQIVPGDKNDFLIKHYEYKDTEKGSELEQAQIRCYGQNSENYVSMECPQQKYGIWEMDYSADGAFIISVWENNYICIYDRCSGQRVCFFHYEGAGEVRHIAMPEEKILILHTIAEEDGRENEEDEKINSICCFVKITLPDMKEDRVFTYHTWYSFNNESQQPAFAFGKNGWEALVFEEGKVKLLDLKTGRSLLVQEIPDGMTPESVCFLDHTSRYAAIYYDHCYSLWNLSEYTHVIYSADILEEAKKVVFDMDGIYIIDRSQDLYVWDFMEEEKARRILPQAELNILGIQYNEQLKEVCVQYFNNSILIFDEKTGKLKTSIFYPAYDKEMQYCDYLIKERLLFMVLGDEETEEILIYSLKNGRSKKIHVNFKSRLRFCCALCMDDGICIAFDKKAVEVHTDSMEMIEIWEAQGSEELISFGGTDEEVELLIREKDWKSMPYYRVFRKDAEKKYVYAGKREAILLLEKQAKNMVSFMPGELAGYCREAGGNLYKKQGLFLEWDSLLLDIYEKAGQKPWELVTVFYRVDNLAKSLADAINSKEQFDICDLSEDEMALTENRHSVWIYQRKNGEVKFASKFKVVREHDESILNVCLGRNGKAYCRLGDETLVKVDRMTGNIEKTYEWIPGLIIAGCDFRGAAASEFVKDVLKKHGGVV
ncbi:MAG: SMEK domain-containing protein [Lachnospiraceae bacterium]